MTEDVGQPRSLYRRVDSGPSYRTRRGNRFARRTPPRAARLFAEPKRHELVHLGSRKCSTVSLTCPQAHRSDSATPILLRKLFRLAIPVRSCANTHASLRFSLPGSAVSIAFENLPTSFGSLLPRCCLAIDSLTVVDFAWCGCKSGARLCFVALYSAAFAYNPSANSVSAGIHMKSTEFSLCFSSFTGS
jgi:hypothetical protein